MKNLKLTNLTKTELSKKQLRGIRGGQACRDTIICECSRKDKRERRKAGGADSYN